VDIRPSAPCEFLLFLSECSALSAQANTTLGKAWFDDIRSTVGPELLAASDVFSDTAPGAPIQLWSRLIPLAYETPAPHDVPAFLAHFATLPPLQVRLTLLGYRAFTYERLAPAETIFLAAQGDETSIREVAAKHFPRDRARREALITLLSGDPQETRTRLLALMQRWYETAFRSQEATILPILERDARAARELGRTLSLEQLVETVTNGIEFQTWPGLTWVALVPTYVMRPWMVEITTEDGTIICYPAADESLVESFDGPPARLVRLHQALGDERRLRILRHLTTERVSFQELANALDLPKSSLHYHLGILRSAGLLRVSIEARGTLYSLRREALTGMVEDLLDYFGRANGGEDEPR
jgi:DNA-binding transcriptional ArsR family regulator